MFTQWGPRWAQARSEGRVVTPIKEEKAGSHRLGGHQQI